MPVPHMTYKAVKFLRKGDMTYQSNTNIRNGKGTKSILKYKGRRKIMNETRTLSKNEVSHIIHHKFKPGWMSKYDDKHPTYSIMH